ncbi:hypothetical protein FF38_06827 [Lucilia cuprina]|uniref:Uncharacterized protein n=1 Tax=Lucilia cuprina TaxID=7375 RepID=A0A0L0C713_LUCCU|nr:hypothetical protein FF38_06827 [Lucilia cuprina]
MKILKNREIVKNTWALVISKFKSFISIESVQVVEQSENYFADTDGTFNNIKIDALEFQFNSKDHCIRRRVKMATTNGRTLDDGWALVRADDAGETDVVDDGDDNNNCVDVDCDGRIFDEYNASSVDEDDLTIVVGAFVVEAAAVVADIVASVALSDS